MNPFATAPSVEAYLFWISPEGRLLHANAQASHALGYSPSELLTLAIWDLDPEFPRARWPEHWHELRAAGALHFQTTHRHQDGSLHPVEVFAHYVDLDGQAHNCALIRPLTPQRQAENALHASEERLTLALAVSGQGLYDLDLTTGRTVFNDAYARMLGYEPGELELTPTLWSNWLHPDERDWILRLYEDCLTGQRADYQAEIRLRKRDGDWIWVHSLGKVVARDSTGRAARLIGTQLDITERKRTEAALRWSEERFRSIFEHAPLGIALVEGADGRIVLSNATFQQLLGYTAEELQHLSVAAITHPDDIDTDLGQYQTLLAEHLPSYRLEKRYLHRDGTPVWVDLTVSVIRDETGNPRYALGMVLDITRRRQTEAALRASETLLDSIIDQSPFPIAIYDRSGTVIRFNRAARDLFRVTDERSALQYNMFEDEQLREQGYLPLLERVFQQGETIRVQTRYNLARVQYPILPQTASLLEIDTTTFPIKDVDGQVTHIVSYHLDITARKAVEARVQYHLDLEQALAEISALMIQPGWEDFDAHVDWTLERITRLTQADRGYLFQIAPAGLTMSNTHEWCAEDIRPQREDAQDLPIADYRPFYDWLQRDEPVEVHTAEVPDGTALKTILEDGQVRSLICVPMRWGGHLRGFIGLDAVTSERRWRDDEIRLLRMVTEILAHTLQHIESDRSLRENARFLEDLDRISRILTERQRDVDLIQELAATILEIFQADRVFFLHPCDPEAASFRIRMEATRPEWPGLLAAQTPSGLEGVEVILEDEARHHFRQVLNQPGPAVFQFAGVSELAEIIRHAGVQSQILIALYPHGDQPWLLGMHQCAGARHWTDTEQRLLQAIAERVSDALSGHLLLQQLQASEERYRAVFDNAHDAIIVHDFQGRVQAVNRTMRMLFGLDDDEAMAISIADISGPGNQAHPPVDHWPRIAAGEILRFEWNARRPRDGTCFPVEVMLRSIRFGDMDCILSNVRDITERKRAEDALRASEERFARAFRSSPAAIVISTLDEGRFIDVNDRWVSMLGYSREELIGHTSKEVGLWTDVELRNHALAEIRTHGGFRDLPAQVRTRTGEVRDQLWSAETINLGGQQVLLSHIHDITEVKRAEDALRQSEERFAKAFQSSPAPMLITTIDEGRIIDVNERWLKLLGTTREALIGRTTSDSGIWTDPGVRDRMIEQIRQTGPFQNCPVSVQARNGERREILWSTEIITLGGHPVLLSLVYDLTDQRRIEQALRESEARLRAAIESIPFDFFILDNTGRYVLQNSACRRRWGDVIGKCPEDVSTDPDTLAHWNSNNRRAFAGETIEEEVHLTQDIGERYIHNVIAPVRDGEAIRGLVGLNIDITERKRAEEELQRYREHLEDLVAERTTALQQANADLRQAMTQLVQAEKLAALGHLVAGVAHELNTPLGNSRMVASTLGEDLRSLGQAVEAGTLRRSQLSDFLDRGREAVDLLERNTVRAADLIGHFKQVAVDQTSMRRRRFDLRQTIEEMLTALGPTFKRTAHQVTLAIPMDLELDSYPGPLEQVISNLISNSLTHGFAGIAAGTIRIEALALDPERVMLCYSDDGRGIPEASITRIFEPFFTTRLGQGGSGLGLYIVYNLVTGVLGGTIAVDSPPDQGATFRLTLPRVAPEPT